MQHYRMESHLKLFLFKDDKSPSILSIIPMINYQLLIKLNQYGSPLWSLNSEEHMKLNRSWNTVIKMVWDLPYATHRRFLESLTDIPHLQSMLHGRYIGFIENLSMTKKPHLQILLNICLYNQSCNTGQNVSYLMRTYESFDIRTLILERYQIKSKRIHPLLEDETWKIEMIEEMCLAK